MKVLFDHNVPRKLSTALSGHSVVTAVEMGWAALENGDLLRVAEEAGFAVMVTADKNLAYQQNLSRQKLAIVVLSTNNWNVLKQRTEPIVLAVNVAMPGSFQVVTL